MTSAKEGSRTPTPVRALEPESFAIRGKGSETTTETICRYSDVGPQKTAANRRGSENTGSRARKPIDEFRIGRYLAGEDPDDVFEPLRRVRSGALS